MESEPVDSQHVGDDIARFGQLFQAFMEQMTRASLAAQRSALRDRLDRHLGTDSAALPVISDSFAAYDHVNVQVALSAYLAAAGRGHELVGLTGQQRHFESLSDLIQSGHHAGVQLGSVDLVNLPVSPDETLACVQFGLFLIEDRGVPVVALLRGPTEFGTQQTVTMELLSPDQERATALLAEVRGLMVERNVFRRQVISFGEPHLGHVGVGPVVFHRRPALVRDQLVLPEQALELVERQVLGIARHRERLRASGQHVKRGLLLYGPPGNGKTLTVRYIVGQALDHTVMLLTGGSLHLLRPACALARMLNPAIVVLEDVDLVAEERGMVGHMSNPVLFDLLNEMDGIEGDADVAFILTTNRADLLEPALAARPGRVDLAVGIGVPARDARRRLLALYAGGLDLRTEDLEPVVDRTEGVSAAFIKELVRKAAVLAAQGQAPPPAPGQAPGTHATATATRAAPLTVTDEHLQGALDELLDETGALTRVLLGARPGAGTGPQDPAAGGWPGAHPASMAMAAGRPGISGMNVGGSRVMSRSSVAVDWLAARTPGIPPATPEPAEPPEEPPADPPSSR
jgi:ATPase family associated with various cellular activities (AAA)